MAPKIKENPRYNLVSTRLDDSTYALLEQFVNNMGVNRCQAVEAFTMTALKMVTLDADK